MKSKSKRLYGHSIKNSDIKHWWELSKKMVGWGWDGKPLWKVEKHPHRRYLCVDAYTPEKVAKKVTGVTCKNCLRELKKRGKV